jgi:hypothetical protein
LITVISLLSHQFIAIMSPLSYLQVAKGLVQVEVAHIRPNDARRGEPQLGVHVGTVHVNLTSVLVHDLAGPEVGMESPRGKANGFGKMI